MALRRTTTLKMGSQMARGPIKKVGPRTTTWIKFRNAKAVKDRNEEGLLLCQDYKIGLPPCGIGRPSLDLHHINGRDGNLLTDPDNLVWLTRPCHRLAHQDKRLFNAS